MGKAELLNTILEENKGFIQTSQVISAGVSKTYFGEYVRKNDLERIAHGLYMSKDAWDDEMYVTQVRYPKAVFSHETALYLLDIAEREPTKYSITFKTGTNSMALVKCGFKVYKIKEELFDLGIMEVKSPSGHTLRTYNVERTICDLIRSRKNIEIQDLQSTIKEYVRRKEKNIPLLMRYAKSFTVEKIVRQYLEVLL